MDSWAKGEEDAYEELNGERERERLRPGGVPIGLGGVDILKGSTLGGDKKEE